VTLDHTYFLRTLSFSRQYNHSTDAPYLFLIFGERPVVHLYAAFRKIFTLPTVIARKAGRQMLETDEAECVMFLCCHQRRLEKAQ
jgi:hypothetical protein